MENTLSDLTDYLKNGIDWEALVDTYIPAEVDWMTVLKFAAIFALGSLLLGCLGRVVMGKRSDLNHALSSAMGILCIYAVTAAIISFNVSQLTRFLSPLPFVAFSGDYMMVLPFHGAEYTDICSEILSMVILAFLVNLLDIFIPKGKSVPGWYLLRFLTVALAMAAHYIITKLLASFLPDVLVTYAPMILLGILGVLLLLGLLKVVLGLLLTVASPVLGAIYTFFFSNLIGKQLGKAVLTTIVLTAVFALMEHFGYTLILIAQTALGAYIPLIFILLILWYLIGHVL